MESITRRTALVLAGSGIGALALASGRQDHVVNPTPEEAANVRLVQDFIRSWTKKEFDPKKVMSRYISSPCVVRVVDSMPAVTTPDAAAQPFIDFIKDGTRIIRVDIHQIMARGKMVVTSRDDITQTPGKPETVYAVVGVFAIQNGKIHEWTDYLSSVPSN